MRNEIEWSTRDPRDCFVYIIGRIDEPTYRIVGPTKVGISQHPEYRLKQLQALEPGPLVLVAEFAFWKRKHALMVEQAFHKKHEIFRDRGEWFDIPPSDVVVLVGKILSSFVEKVLRTNDTDDFFTAYDHLGVPGFAYDTFPATYYGDDPSWQ